MVKSHQMAVIVTGLATVLVVAVAAPVGVSVGKPSYRIIRIWKHPLSRDFQLTYHGPLVGYDTVLTLFSVDHILCMVYSFSCLSDVDDEIIEMKWHTNLVL